MTRLFQHCRTAQISSFMIHFFTSSSICVLGFSVFSRKIHRQNSLLIYNARLPRPRYQDADITAPPRPLPRRPIWFTDFPVTSSSSKAKTGCLFAPFIIGIVRPHLPSASVSCQISAPFGIIYINYNINCVQLRFNYSLFTASAIFLLYSRYQIFFTLSPNLLLDMT